MPKLIVKTMSITEAADIMRQAGIRGSAERVKFGIQQGVYKWGECIQMPNSPQCVVYAKLFYEWLKERGEEVEE